MLGLFRRGGRFFSTLTSEEIASNKALLSPVLTHLTEVVVEKAQGSWITATDGGRYLDFTTGIGVTNIGHCHPRVVQAIKEGAEVVLHAQQNIVWHKGQLQLLRLLRDVVMPYHEQFFFANSGAEAVEAALKLARHATGKPNVIVMQGGYHGRTVGTMSLTHSNHIYRRGYQPLMPGVFVAPFPYCKKCSGCRGQCGAAECCLEPLELLLRQQTAPAETAAVIIEPVLGEGGYVPAPASYLTGLRRLCDKHGLLMVADEVQTGFGRTGDWMAMSGLAVKPDITVFAKGVASGLPLSGIGASQDLMAKWQKGTHGGTYGGNALATLAACATIEAIRDERLLDNCRQRGAELKAALAATQQRHPDVIFDVRGLGLMVGVEFKAPAGFAAKVSQACLRRNMLLLTCSVFETVRFIPPINITKEDLEKGIAIFNDAVQEVVSSQ